MEKYIPVKKGKMHVLRVVREILCYQPRRLQTRLTGALEYLHNVLTRTSVIFIISDFLDKDYSRSLKILSRRHDVIAIHLKDPRENVMPAVGLVEFKDRETGDSTLIDTSRKFFQQKFQADAAERNDYLERLFKSLRIDKIVIGTEGGYVEPLMAFFKARESRL